jgi:hypothetical protein
MPRYRSKLEARLAKSAPLKGARYEAEVMFYPKGIGRYTPDFVLPNGIYLEVKGRFLAKDRAKMLAVKGAHLDCDIRLVFQRPQMTLSKVSQTTYAAWATKHGFPWCAASDTATLTKWAKEKPR